MVRNKEDIKMEIKKKKRSRAIIINNDKLVSMYREFDERVFYVFPGGGMEENETEEECVIREVYEEFGINITPLKKVYIYETEKGIEYFYLCEWIDGEFATGTGEEYDVNANKEGVYIPKLIEISSIPTLPLMPAEIASAFYKDYITSGITLRNDIKHIIV